MRHVFLFRNDVTHYTGQLAKETSDDLKELNKFPVGDPNNVSIYAGDSCLCIFSIYLERGLNYFFYV